MVLCDLLIRLGLRGTYRPLWSKRILEETANSILRRRPDLKPEQLERRVALMNEALPAALVQGYEAIEASVAQFGKDGHVVAAAIFGRADLIVTYNIKDFPASQLAPFHIEALTPDDFLVNQFWLDPTLVRSVIAEQAADTSRPPLSVADVIERLRAEAPNFARLLDSETDIHKQGNTNA